MAVWRDEKSLWCHVSKAAAWGCHQLRGKEAPRQCQTPQQPHNCQLSRLLNFHRRKLWTSNSSRCIVWFPESASELQLHSKCFPKSFIQCQNPLGQLDVGFDTPARPDEATSCLTESALILLDAVLSTSRWFPVLSIVRRQLRVLAESRREPAQRPAAGLRGAGECRAQLRIISQSWGPASCGGNAGNSPPSPLMQSGNFFNAALLSNTLFRDAGDSESSPEA